MSRSSLRLVSSGGGACPCHETPSRADKGRPAQPDRQGEQPCQQGRRNCKNDTRDSSARTYRSSLPQRETMDRAACIRFVRRWSSMSACDDAVGAVPAHEVGCELHIPRCTGRAVGLGCESEPSILGAFGLVGDLLGAPDDEDCPHRFVEMGIVDAEPDDVAVGDSSLSCSFTEAENDASTQVLIVDGDDDRQRVDREAESSHVRGREQVRTLVLGQLLSGVEEHA